MTLNDPKDHQVLNELYIEACSALLSAYGLAVSVREGGAAPSACSEASYVSVLGASGKGIRLSSILRIEQSLVSRIHPSGEANISQSDLEDWCLELNNQLVGRLKNKLLGYAYTLAVGLPLLFTGTDVSAVNPPNSEVHQYSVESADGQITLTLATLIGADLKLHERKRLMQEDVVLVEGSVALF